LFYPNLKILSMKKNLLVLTILTIFGAFSTLFAQEVTVSVADVVNFWEAYDSVQTTTDRQKRLDFIQKLYIDRGTQGLKDVQELRGVKTENWLELIDTHKEDLEKKRPFTLTVLNQKPILDKKLKELKNFYPNFKGGAVYFLVGCWTFGGTIKGDHALVGVEIAASEREDWAVELVLHEFIHTIQVPCNYHFLSHTIREGMADFCAELLYGEKTLAELYPNMHTAFGLKNEAAIWADYKKYIHINREAYYQWLYGLEGRVINGKKMRDLGYFMGYQICKSYYNKAIDKKQAFQNMIELDLTSDEKAREFLLESGYLSKKDEKFVRKMVFSRIPPDARVGKMKTIGYKIVKNHVIFSYNLLPSQKDTKTVSIAGSFNGWIPNLTNFTMKKVSDIKFELAVPIAQFEKGKIYQFKFVLDGNNWQDPPFEAKNTLEEGGYTNLSLRL
jgi:hypothetical protein